MQNANKVEGLKTNFEVIGLNTDATDSTTEHQSDVFPVDVLPIAVQEIIAATNQSLNFPVDFIGASLLYAVSVAIGNTYRVQVTPDWVESAVLYLAIVAKAGTNKSHPLSFALRPIVEHDKGTYSQYEAARKEFDAIAKLSKSERTEQCIDEPIKPVWQKMLLSDFTPEALAEVHKFNKRGIGVYVDELAGWFKNFNRYNKGSEMEFWLSVWSGKPINIDRKTGEPIFIPLPFVSVCGTIQNGILNELAKDSRTQNGFIDRILFVAPNNVLKPYWSDVELSPDIPEMWGTIVSNLLALSITHDDTLNPVPDVLKFTPEAKRVLLAWQRTNADQCNATDNEAIAGIYSKLEVYAIRLSLVLQMLFYASGESDKNAVGLDAVVGALALIAYFKKSAIKVQTIISNVSPLDKLSLDKQNVYCALPDNFETGEGEHIAAELGMERRAYYRFLSNTELFKRLEHGKYAKVF